MFADPSLASWGAGELSDAEITAKYLGGRSPEVECFLVQHHGAAVGFAQIHTADDGGEGGGMDMILLSPARGQGIGTAVVRQLVCYVQTVKHWIRFSVDPDVTNPAGVAFWRSVGFIPQYIVSDDPNRQPHWIMTRPTRPPKNTQ